MIQDYIARRSETWLQWALIILTLIGAIVHNESRLARVEQTQADAAERQTEITDRLTRIEERINRAVAAPR